MSIPDAVLRAGAVVADAVHAAADEAGLLGPDADDWNDLRRTALPAVDSLTGGLVDATRSAEPERYAGTLGMPERDAGELLSAAGFERNPFSALKLREGEPEAGSWVLRDDADESRQVHVVLFEAEAGVDVYAHEEYSSLDPAVVPDHYRGRGVDGDLGVAFASALYPDVMGVDESLVDSVDRSPGPSLTADLGGETRPQPAMADGGEVRDDGNRDEGRGAAT